MSQRRLNAMRTQYEEKLQVLEHRIRQTETERDRVLGSMSEFCVEKLSFCRCFFLGISVNPRPYSLGSDSSETFFCLLFC